LEIVIFIGLQGSGKSSFYRAHFADTHTHLSKDNWPTANKREARQQRLLHEYLSAGQNVVVDNTNISRARRAPLIEIAHEYNARIIGYYFESNIEDCKARNAAREGRARVPDIAIYVTAAQLEPPAINEGFYELYFVRLRDGIFNISDLFAGEDDEIA
jgi:predicted kinase